MKYLSILFIAIITLTMYSCSKPDSEDNDNIQFSVNGITDLKFPANLSGTLVLEIKHLSGNQENVTLSVNRLPANVSYEFSTSSGIPTFSTTLNITANNAIPGVYPVSILVTSTNGVSNNYNFNLEIEESFNCATLLLGTYNGVSICDVGNNNAATQVISIDPNTVYGFIIEDYASAGNSTLKGLINCLDNTITIPEQKFNYSNPWPSEQTYTGNGKFIPPNTLELTINSKLVVHNTGQTYNETCSFTYSK